MAAKLVRIRASDFFKLLNIKHVATRLVCAIVAAILVAGLAGAPVTARADGDYTVFGMRREGQATLIVDDATHTAYIVDLGHKGVGDATTLYSGGAENGLLEYLSEKRHVETLYIACSHPHTDHMGGIEGLFDAQRGQFFIGGDPTKPRFKKIVLIDDDAKQSLKVLYDQAKAKSPELTRLNVEYRPVTMHKPAAKGKKAPPPTRRNAFVTEAAPAGVTNGVVVQNIPYALAGTEKVGEHGRALVTLITLRDGDSVRHIVDFDDADSKAIASAVKTLRTTLKIEKIEAFIVPHHGSNAHNIDPILELKPGYAVISVNPENRYRHPHAQILNTLIDQMDAHNVLFTGTDGDVVFNGKGLKTARYRADSFESYALFVADGYAKLRADEDTIKNPKPWRKDELAAYDQLHKKMGGGPFMPPPPPDASLAPAPGGRGPRSPSGGGFAMGLMDRIDATGSILPAGFEAGMVPARGTDDPSLAKTRVFSANAERASVVYSSLSEPYPAGTLYMIDGKTAGQTGEMRFQSGTGLPSRVIPAQPYTAAGANKAAKGDGKVASVSKPATAPKVVPGQVPAGGMVYLNGGQVTVGGAPLLSPRVEIRGNEVWMTTRTEQYRLPFNDASLFTEVLGRVNSGTRSFYLSINPKKKFLQPGFDMSKIPPELVYGTSSSPEAMNDVVTAGDIGTSRIGDILWRADVAFKSEGLGFNVLAPRPATVAAQWMEASSETDDGYTRLPAEGDRWCRLYWASGNPRFVFETNGKVTVTGKAVEAKAEAMQPEGGQLVSVPKGRWCGREKQMAASLENRAGKANATGVLLELKQLALMQSFALWAVDNRVDITAIRSGPYKTIAHIPTWTSGIRTANITTLRVEQEIRPGFRGYNLHYWTNSEHVENCIGRYWPKTDEQLAKIGIVWQRVDKPLLAAGNASNSPPQYQLALRKNGIPEFEKGVNTLVSNAKSCSNAQQLPTVDVRSKTQGAGAAYLKQVPHQLSSYIHGGVLLGKAGAAKPFAYLDGDEAVLWSEDGRLLVRNIGGELNFWNVLGDDAETATGARHAVLSQGQIVDAYADEGHLRFIVKARPGAFIREELRDRPDDGDGVEWLRVRHADFPDTDKETAPSDSVLNLRVTPQRNGTGFEWTDMKDTSPGDTADKGLSVRRIAEAFWVIDLDLTRTERVLMEKPVTGDRTEQAAALSAALDLARWGFRSRAVGIYLDQLYGLSPDADDSITRERVTGMSVTDMAIIASDEDLTKKLTNATAETLSEILEYIGGVRALADTLSPPAAYRVLDGMPAACAAYSARLRGQADTSTLDPLCADMNWQLTMAAGLLGAAPPQMDKIAMAGGNERHD